MRLFSSGYVRRLDRLGLKDGMEVLKLYVDDFNQIGTCLPPGTWYNQGRMFMPGIGWRGRSYPGHRLSKESIKDIETRALEEAVNMDQETRERRSAAIFREIANEVRPRA